MELFSYPIVVFWLVVSIIALVVSVFLGMFIPDNTIVTLLSILLSQAASSIFFPIIVGYFYDKLKEEQSGNAIWLVFREFSEGGIERVYKDREENSNPDNAQNRLREAFSSHKRGDVKLIGVSLRVFFNSTGPFYQAISKLVSGDELVGRIHFRALISHPDSPEVKNRAEIETPRMHKNPLIKSDITLTTDNIEYLRRTFPETALEYGYYKQAPYCTLIIFPDKCFFSPNLLSTVVPVRLPMIIFKSGSHGYNVLNKYFDYLWDKQIPLNITEDN